MEKPLDNLRKDVEKKIYKEKRAFYTVMESWILEEGSKPDKDKIDFNLWENLATAKKDLETIFKQFPEFKEIYDSIVGNDAEKEKAFIGLFQEKLQKQVAIREKKKLELAEFNEKEGGNFLADRIEALTQRISTAIEEKRWGEVAIAGGLLLAGFYGLRAVWKGIKGMMGKDAGVVSSLLVGGGLTAGVVYGLMEISKPESDKDKLKATAESAVNTTNLSAEQKRIMEIIEKGSGAKALMGLTHTPLKTVLAEYRKSENLQINPQFLKNYIDRLKGYGFPQKWASNMIDKINPSELYGVVNSTFKIFSCIKKAVKENPSLTLVDYIEEKYVKDAEAKNTTIDFSEFNEDALEIVAIEEDKTQAEKKKAEAAVSEYKGEAD